MRRSLGHGFGGSSSSIWWQNRNTQVSYRDTLALLLPFASKHGGRAIDRMTIEDLAPSVVRKFLDHLARIMRSRLADVA